MLSIKLISTKYQIFVKGSQKLLRNNLKNNTNSKRKQHFQFYRDKNLNKDICLGKWDLNSY